ncbi:hypothetical protein RB595_009988 [Gaeumannomyces hyphopodioides]
MSGAEVIGVIASVIGILTAARDAYDSIQDIRGLPETFRQIPPKVDLAVATLDQIHRGGCTSSGAELNTVAALANQCSENAERLSLVLRKLNLDKSTPFRERYVSIIQGWGKKGRVEDLLKRIMEDVMLLANHKMVAATGQGQVRKLEQAVEDLDKAEPSVPDHMLERKTDIYIGGTGAQNNQIHHTTNTYSGSSSSYAISGPGQNFGNLAGATLNFGTASEETPDSRCRAALRSRSTDPRHDKARIEKDKDGVLNIAFQWVLHNPEFQRWRSGPDARLLWVKGDPGKGKTMLLCGIINELERTSGDRPLAYFFCQAADPRINTGTAVLLGLMYFLVDIRPDLLKHLRRSYDDAKEALFQGPNLWIALEGIMFRTAEQATRLSLEINEDAVAAAVNAFIHHRVEKLAQSKGLNAKTCAEVENYLSSKAHGTFLWVALVCHALSKVHLPGLVKETLTSFPPGLEGLYHRMLQQISSSTEAAMYWELLALNLVVYRPLCVHELASVAPAIWKVAGSAEGLATMLQLCGSFLMIRDNTIFWVHQSARDYLKQHDFSAPSSMEQAHHSIYQSSLEAMSTTLRRDIYGMIQQHGRLAYGLPVDQFEQQRPKPDPLASVGYSCVYWVDHLRDSHSPVDSDDRGEDDHLRRFLETHFLYWLEALSLLRSIYKGVLSMHSLVALVQDKRVTTSTHVPSQRKSITAAWAKARSRVLGYTQDDKSFVGKGKQRDDSPKVIINTPATSRTRPTLADLVRDMWRFLLTFKLPLEQHPLQGYISGLVMSPTESITRSLFLKDRPDWLTEKLTLPKTWDNCLQTLEGHRGRVDFTTFSPDGQRLASVSFGGIAKVWDVASGKELFTQNCGHEYALREDFTPEFGVESAYTAVFSPDSCRLAGVHSEWIIIWDMNTGKELRKLNHPWGERKCQDTFERHFDNPVTFSANGLNLLSTSSKGEIKTWALATGEEIRMFGCNENSRFRSAVFSSDGRLLAAGREDGKASVWDVVKESKIKTIAWGRPPLVNLSFSCDSKYLAMRYKRKIAVYSFTTGKLKSSSVPRSLFLWYKSAFALSPCGLRLAIAAHNNVVIHRFDKNTHELLAAYTEVNSVHSVAFSPDGRRLAMAQKGDIRLWDTSTDDSQAEPMPTSEVRNLRFSDNSPRVAIVSKRNITVHDLHLGTACEIRLKDAHSVSLSSDGQRMATAHTKCITIWSPENGLWTAQKKLRLPGGCGRGCTMVFSPDAQQLAHLGRPPTTEPASLQLLNVETGQCNTIAESIMVWYTPALAFSENSQRLAFVFVSDGDTGSPIKVWNTLTGDCLFEKKQVDIGQGRASTFAERGGKFMLGPKGAYDISDDGCWITKGGARLLWLPQFCRPLPDSRGECWIMTYSSAVAFANQSGSLYFFDFGEQEE